MCNECDLLLLNSLNLSVTKEKKLFRINTQNTENIIINIILFCRYYYYKCYLISGYYRIIISLSLIIAGYCKIIIINCKLKRSSGYVALRGNPRLSV